VGEETNKETITFVEVRSYGSLDEGVENSEERRAYSPDVFFRYSQLSC
jgi:hypothetical protein